MKRYLMYFSYIGSGFRGLQRQIPRNLKLLNALPAVAEVIEDAFQRRLGLPDIPILHTASRTDVGVHALRTSAHIDLPKSHWKTEDIVYSLNYYFKRISCPIWVLSLQRVSDNFDSRSYPIQRSYLYRFAVVKRGSKEVDNHRLQYLLPTPVTEYLRCYFVPNAQFDVDAVRDVLPSFCGTRDFRTFMAAPGRGGKKARNLLSQEINTTRTLDSFTLTEGRPFIELPGDDFHYWELRCTGKSFLYKQVRRMVSVILGVANGDFTSDDVSYMFDNPSPDSWRSSLRTVPAHGLYLTNVVYMEKDLIPPPEESKPEITVDLKTSPKDLVGLSINAKINLRLKKLKLEKKEALQQEPR